MALPQLSNDFTVVVTKYQLIPNGWKNEAQEVLGDSIDFSFSVSSNAHPEYTKTFSTAYNVVDIAHTQTENAQDAFLLVDQAVITWADLLINYVNLVGASFNPYPEA
jgi:hypothetical protein